MRIYIIGAGGVGSWLTPAMCMLVKPEDITVVDGDTLEKKNLSRQLFGVELIGMNKSSALAAAYSCECIPKYFMCGDFQTERDDWMMCCVDNNVGRLSILESCDIYGTKAIFGSNEVTSAEAFYYDPQWKDGPHDPRIYYPEMKTELSGDPMARSIGCTGEAQKKNIQLVSANISAMSLMLQLFGIWQLDRSKFTKEVVRHLPYQLIQNQTKFETMTINKKEELCQTNQ